MARFAIPSLAGVVLRGYLTLDIRAQLGENSQETSKQHWTNALTTCLHVPAKNAGGSPADWQPCRFVRGDPTPPANRRRASSRWPAHPCDPSELWEPLILQAEHRPPRRSAGGLASCGRLAKAKRLHSLATSQRCLGGGRTTITPPITGDEGQHREAKSLSRPGGQVNVTAEPYVW